LRADAEGRGIKLIIAGAGGAAHLPGMIAAQTTLPVLGVPVESRSLRGVDSLLSIVQMPAGIPVATFAIGMAGAMNAAYFAVSMLAAEDESLGKALKGFREKQTADVSAMNFPCKRKRRRVRSVTSSDTATPALTRCSILKRATSHLHERDARLSARECDRCHGRGATGADVCHCRAPHGLSGAQLFTR
jgi:phosphoribosylaminoimidazole carboxylase PurE protein